MKAYLHRLLRRYIGLYVMPKDSVVVIDPHSDMMSSGFERVSYLFTDAGKCQDYNGRPCLDGWEGLRAADPDYALLDGALHYTDDIQSLLIALHDVLTDKTRVIITFYSNLWYPLVQLATWLGFRSRQPEENWISHEDMANFCRLTGFEIVRQDSRVLLPLWIPLLSELVNRFLAPLPIFRWLTLVNVVILRPLIPRKEAWAPSVSVVVAARNEEGHIDEIIERLPQMGPDDELIFVEGNSTDQTWKRILQAQERCIGKRSIVVAQQDGKGKGDAVRKGFAIASKQILMILDADMSVPPEELPKFYAALTGGKGEFVNGSRLVYSMESGAMRFLNIVGNKFFASAFSFLLGQRFKDTLCGTKALTRANYEKLAQHRSYFGDFDPFGDFDLIFGAARMGLRIVELPIHYKERRYGQTNIQRWRHGVILLRMTMFAALKLKFF
jgi:hypothetical protein